MSEFKPELWQTLDGAFRPGAGDVIHQAIRDTESLDGRFIAARLEPWSVPHRHVSGRWLPTGTPAVMKLSVSESELAALPECWRWLVTTAPWPLEAAWPEGKNGTGHYRGLIQKMGGSGMAWPSRRNRTWSALQRS